MRVIVEADGGSRGNPGPAGYGAVVRDADTGEVLEEAAAGIGIATNNVAEYQGLLAGLRAALRFEPESVDVRMDSKLVVQQMKGEWQVKHPDMRTLRKEAATLVARLAKVTFRHIPREQNSYADRLANEAMDAAARGETWARTTDVTEVPATNRLSGWMAAAGPPVTTLLLRHGQTPLSVEKRFSGIGDAELTDLGRTQAAAAARRVAAAHHHSPIGAVYSSPLSRAHDTATAAAQAIGADVVVVDDLRETAFGEWEGHSFGEVRKQWPDQLAAWLADPSVPPPGGESFDATTRRVLRVRDELVAKHAGETILMVSHVTPIKVLLRAALEAPPSALYRLHIDLASLSEVDWHVDGIAVTRRVNDTAHLESG